MSLKRRKHPVDTTALRPPSALLLALEARAGFEWMASALSWPWLRQAPRGDGHPVLVLPGLAAGDASTALLRRYLQGQGYAAYPWELGANVGPRDDLVRGLTARVRQLERRHKRRLSLVGWSLGGAMARTLAVTMPERVRAVITLGSPIAGSPRATNAWRLFQWVSGLDAEDPRLRELMARQPEAPHTAIFSKTDGIVNWRMSMAPPGPQTENIEVSASHFGLGANPAVLWAIADRLAQPEGGWQPFDRNGWRSLFYRHPDQSRLADLIAP